VLLSPLQLLNPYKNKKLIEPSLKARIRKNIVVESIPDEIEKFPWSGHLGLKLIDKVIPIINESHYAHLH
jgi:ATP-dependent Lhr-like helicase